MLIKVILADVCFSHAVVQKVQFAKALGLIQEFYNVFHVFILASVLFDVGTCSFVEVVGRNVLLLPAAAAVVMC